MGSYGNLIGTDELLCQLLTCLHTEANWLMQLAIAGGTLPDVSPLHSARASRACLGLEGERSWMQ